MTDSDPIKGSADVCDWCRRPMRVGEECRVAWRREGPALWWHLECSKEALRPFNASATADSPSSGVNPQDKA